MSSIVRQRVGSHTYLYESVSYRDKDGKPRNKRTPIGKIDPATGQPAYKPEYLGRMADEGRAVKPAPQDCCFSRADIMQSSVRDYGAFYLLREMAARSGLLESLQAALPEYWETVFNLAAYLVTVGDPFSYCEDWLDETEAFPVGPMTSQRISELLCHMTQDEMDSFYQTWCAKRSDREYIALDITSVSSYSELIESVEWGYNRDGEKLPQVNICLLMGYESRYPIYQSVYGGSLKDVSTLKSTLGSFGALAGGKPIVAVMDKGFFSAMNVNAMLSAEQHVDFVIAVPFTSKFASELVNGERPSIDTLENTIVCGGESLRAVTKLRRWSSSHKVFAHVYYNAKKAQGIREALYARVAMLREQAIARPEQCVSSVEHAKYLIIRRSFREDSGYTVNLREDVVANELGNAGWLVAISNHVADAKEAIKIYREKDIVEKGFQRLKNSLDLARLRVHSENSMHGKVFVGFVSLILLSGIHSMMADKQLYGRMTMRKLLLTLAKLKLQTVKGVRILFTVTKEQRDIFEAFDIPLPA